MDLRSDKATRPSTRIGHSKSRNGCPTCKIRKVKCDERKPSCGPCRNTGRQCDFILTVKNNRHSYLPFQVLANPTTSQSPSTKAINNRERHAFQFFFQVVAPNFSGTLDASFWNRTVLQASRTEPFIWDTVICLSLLVQHPIVYTAPFVGLKASEFERLASLREAHLCYQRALRGFRQQLRRGAISTYHALLSCVLFICIELLNVNLDGVFRLYGHGLRLISESLDGGNDNCLLQATSDTLRELTGSVQPIFNHLGAMVGMTNQPLLQHNLRPPGASRFNHLWDTRNSFESLLSQITNFNSSADKQLAALANDPDGAHQLLLQLEPRSQELQAQLSDWFANFVTLGVVPKEGVEELGRISTKRVETHASALLLAGHAALAVLIESFPSNKLTSMYTDPLRPHFESAVRYSAIAIEAYDWTAPDMEKSPPFLPEIHIAGPLFVSAALCRHPRIRREAFALLQKIPKVHALYKTTPYDLLIPKLISLEENCSFYPDPKLFNGVYSEAELVPEERRIVNHTLVRPVTRKRLKGNDNNKEESLMWCMEILRRPQEEGNVLHNPFLLSKTHVALNPS